MTDLAAPDLFERQVHLSCLVREDAEAADPVRHPFNRVGAVLAPETDEQEEATTDPADHLSIDPDFGAADALQDDPHSTVTDFARLRG